MNTGDYVSNGESRGIGTAGNGTYTGLQRHRNRPRDGGMGFFSIPLRKGTSVD